MASAIEARLIVTGAEAAVRRLQRAAERDPHRVAILLESRRAFVVRALRPRRGDGPLVARVRVEAVV